MQPINLHPTSSQISPLASVNREEDGISLDPINQDVPQQIQEGNTELEQMEIEDAPMEEGLPALTALLDTLLSENSSEARQKAMLSSSLAYSIPSDLQYRVDIKLLAMLCGDKIIGSTNLEGYSPENVLEYILQVLSSNSIPLFNDKEELIKELTELKEMSEATWSLSSEEECRRSNS